MRGRLGKLMGVRHDKDAEVAPHSKEVSNEG